MHENADRLSAVAFDYGGVLAHFIDETTMCHMAEIAGVSPHSFRQPYWTFRPQYDSGEIGLKQYWHKVLETAGSSTNGEDVASVLSELDAIGWSRMNTAVLRWAFELLNSGYRCFIISNMAVSAYEMVIGNRTWATYFETHIISGQLRVNKPDPEIFRTALQQTKLDASEVLFLDDSENNVRAARGIGMYGLKVSTAQKLSTDMRRHFPELPSTGLTCKTEDNYATD